MISKIAPRRAPVRSESVGTAVKKLAARAEGYAQRSGFDGARRAGAAIGKGVRRETMEDINQIKQGLRRGNAAAVKVGVASTAARLDLKLPDLSRLTAWGAFGALGTALGHIMLDPLRPNRGDFKAVMSLAGRINDPDPSNGRVG